MEKYLRRCLASLIIDDAGMRLLEVLVINDGSKDSSSAIAHEYQDKYPDTFRVIDKENGNYGSCINRGLKEATGKYVKVLDADDWFNTQSLCLVLKKLDALDVDMVLTNNVTVNELGNITSYSKPKLKEGVELDFNDIVTLNEYTPIQMHWIIYKKSILNRIEYQQTEGMSYTDTEWVLYPSVAVEKVMYINTYLYCYLVGREGQTMSDEEIVRTSSTFLRLVEILFNNSKKYLAQNTMIHDKFVKDYLYWQTKFLYDRYLLVKRNNLSDLIDFDRLLDSSIISKLDDTKICGIKYVNIWHKNKCKKLPQWVYFYLDMRFLLRMIKTKIHKKWQCRLIK